MTETARRVALLVRPGVAGDRLRELLAEAGIESVLQGDPTELAAEALAESGPQVVLVALDPETEDALERFDSVLGNPDVDVIYEEAELAAVREGWEQARWKRHLLAKLQGHDRVLPPRPDGAADTDPGSLQLHSVEDVSDEDFHAFDPTADEVRDDAATQSPADVAGAFERGGMDVDGLDVPQLDEAASNGRAMSLDDEASALERVLDEAPAAGDPNGADALHVQDVDATAGLDDAQADGADEVIELDTGGYDFSSSNFDPALAEAEEAAGGGDDSGFEITFDLGGDDAAAAPRESDGGLEAHLESLIRASSDDGKPSAAADEASGGTDGGMPSRPASASVPPPLPPSASTSGSTFGELSLDDGDTPYSAPEKRAADDRFGRDLAELDERISSLELVDDNAERGATVPGAVLVMAGIGGPDAVRQLLGALPGDFPRPVLVQQRLDGGRYDRLVAQMQRATTLPVQLAEPGKPAMAGFVYMLPAGLGIKPAAEGIRFEAEGDVLAALPAADSAVVLLSGSDPADVDMALKHRAGGALVAGQSAEGCYDASASDQLVARGGESGQPAEIALHLATRWQA